MKRIIIWLCVVLCMGCVSHSKVPIDSPPMTRPEVITVTYNLIVAHEDLHVAQDAIWQIHNAESLFFPLQIHFQLGQIYTDLDSRDCYQNRYGVLSIYIVKRRAMMFQPDGMSVLPWQNQPPTIWITGCQDPSTYAHECGHTFGLLHTFNENDYVDDTPRDFMNADSRNIMNYSNWPWYFQEFTPGQLERAKLYLKLFLLKHKYE